MSAWDDLSEQDKNLIVTALQVAPAATRGDDSTTDLPTEAEYDELARRLEAKPDLAQESMERALTVLIGQINEDAAEVREHALRDTLTRVTRLLGPMAFALGGMTALVDEFQRGAVPLDTAVMSTTDEARAVLVTWKAMEAQIEALLTVLRAE